MESIRLKAYLDEKAIAAFSRHSILYLVKLLGALAALIGGTGIVLLIAGFDFTVSLTVTLAGVIVPAFLLLITYFFIPRQVKKTPAANQKIEQDFTFGEKIILNETSAVAEAKNIEYLWAAFFRAAETDDYFFLYVNKYTAFILPKSGFTEGTPEDLRAEFINRFGKKFSCAKKFRKQS